jgi:hypothetical protein
MLIESGPGHPGECFLLSGQAMQADATAAAGTSRKARTWYLQLWFQVLVADRPVAIAQPLPS